MRKLAPRRPCRPERVRFGARQKPAVKEMPAPQSGELSLNPADT
jgi:hypothetical protein